MFKQHSKLGLLVFCHIHVHAAFTKGSWSRKLCVLMEPLFVPSVDSFAILKVQLSCADGGFAIGFAALCVDIPHSSAKSIILQANALKTFGSIFAGTFFSQRHRPPLSSKNSTLSQRVSLSGFPFYHLSSLMPSCCAVGHFRNVSRTLRSINY